MIKSFTDLEQSKKLAEILPLESADMHYATWTILDNEFIASPNQGSTIKDLQEDYGNQIIPCWSLAALLGVLPDESEDNHFLTLQKEKNEYCCCYEDINGNSFKHTFADNPIDACVAMIEKLNELNLL